MLLSSYVKDVLFPIKDIQKGAFSVQMAGIQNGKGLDLLGGGGERRVNGTFRIVAVAI